MRNKPKLHFTYLALLTGLTTGLPAYAEEESIIEEVVVTGTRIKSNANSSQPISTLTSEQISYSGQGDLAFFRYRGQLSRQWRQQSRRRFR